jgi:tetratricopeptide (TPR) repeat protein
MTTPTPTGETSPAPDPPRPAPVAAPARLGYRGALLVGVVVLLAGAGAAWWWLRPEPVTPPMPGGIEDPEVRQAVTRARQDVLGSPRSAAAWGHLGKVLLAHTFPREADGCFAQAARLDPANPMWFYARGVIAQREDPEKPLTRLRQAVAAGGARPEDQSAMSLYLAEVLLERGGLEEAEGLFRKELARAPSNPRAVFGLALIAVARGDSAAATKLLTVAQASPFARKRATAQLAALARARGERQVADNYEKQIAALPDDPPWPDPLIDELGDLRVGWLGRERHATWLEKQGRFAQAAQVYLEQIAKQPNVSAYIGASLNLTRVRDYERAVRLARAAVRLGPDDAAAHFCLAFALSSRAKQQWEKAPASAQAREWFREAVEHTRKAAEQRPGHAQTYLVWGLSLKYLGEPGAAVEPLRQGIACTPGDLQLQLGLGEVLLDLGRLKEAEVHLENARRLAPNDPRPARALERLRLKKG